MTLRQSQAVYSFVVNGHCMSCIDLKLSAIRLKSSQFIYGFILRKLY